MKKIKLCVPSYKAIPSTLKSDLIRGLACPEEDNLLVFYYLKSGMTRVVL